MDAIRCYEVGLGSVAARLRGYFERRRGVTIAVLFGSVLRHRLVRDVDVAVYLEEGLGIDRLLEMADEVERLLGVPADVVPLAELPPGFRLRVLDEGIPLVVRNKGLYTELYKEALGELEDLRLAGV